MRLYCVLCCACSHSGRAVLHGWAELSRGPGKSRCCLDCCLLFPAGGRVVLHRSGVLVFGLETHLHLLACVVFCHNFCPTSFRSGSIVINSLFASAFTPARACGRVPSGIIGAEKSHLDGRCKGDQRERRCGAKKVRQGIMGKTRHNTKHAPGNTPTGINESLSTDVEQQRERSSG